MHSWHKCLRHDAMSGIYTYTCIYALHSNGLLLTRRVLHFALVTIATVGIELERQTRTELRSVELDHALKRPRTTVTELRAFERCKCL